MNVLTKCPRYDFCSEIQLQRKINTRGVPYIVDCEHCDFFKMYCMGWNDAVKAIEDGVQKWKRRYRN